MNERRESDRKPSSLRVEIFHPSMGTLVGKGRDISDTGISALFDQVILPPPGTLVQVKMKRLTGTINEDSIAMKVVRHERNIVALVFSH